MRIAVSLSLVIIISLALGYAFRNILGFFETAILAAFIQLIAPSVWNAVFKYKEKILQLESEINYLVEISTATVDCPCGKHKFNEIIVGAASSATARVKEWNASTNKLEISIMIL